MEEDSSVRKVLLGNREDVDWDWKQAMWEFCR